MIRPSPIFRIFSVLLLVGGLNIDSATQAEQKVFPDPFNPAPNQAGASAEPQILPESERPVQHDPSSELQPPHESEIPDHSEEAVEPDSSVEPDATVELEAEPPVPITEANPSIMLTGRVWRAKPGIVFLKTPIGLLSLSSKTTLKTIPASQEISFIIHDDHLVVDIVKRTDGTLVHRFLSGPFRRSDEDETQLIAWTPDGERAFHMGNHARTLSRWEEGRPITIEVDSTNTVLGEHDLQFDLQVGQIATRGSRAHLLLTGTISKLKSNFIFFRTPIGIVNVNAKIGIKNVKVGQTMTLHMHDHYVVADLAPSNDAPPSRRFVTGPLEFSTSDRSSVRLWTPEGEQTYPTDVGKGALNGTREGTLITVELNGQGDVVDFHRVK
jgi:hypothetical protein